MEVDPDDFKKLIGLLQQLVDKSSVDIAKSEEKQNDDEEIESKENFSIKKSPNKKNNKKNNKKKTKFENKFLTMKEASMHKDDTEIDKKLNKTPPTQRTRNFQYVDMRCRVCGKVESVSPALAEARDRYKCNRCSASPG